MGTIKDAEGNDKERVYYKAPKIQRLITEKRIRRKKTIKNERVNRWKTTKEQKQKYEKLISQFVKEKKAAQKAEKEAAARPRLPRLLNDQLLSVDCHMVHLRWA